MEKDQLATIGWGLNSAGLPRWTSAVSLGLLKTAFWFNY